METENVQGKKVRVKGGGVCIYCGWDGGAEGLRDEHIVPYSLGGNTVLAKATCAACEAITSYLDGYMANAVFGHLRAHLGLQSRSGHPDTLPALVELADGQRAIELAAGDHPYFLNMPTTARIHDRETAGGGIRRAWTFHILVSAARVSQCDRIEGR